MNKQELLKALKPETRKVQLDVDMDLFIRLPSLQNMQKCQDVVSNILYCICDENAVLVFEEKDLDLIDSKYLSQMNEQIITFINEMFGIESTIEEHIEKK